MREPGLGWMDLIVANSPGGDGVEEFDEGHMAGQWGVVQNYSAEKYPNPLVLGTMKKVYALKTLQAVLLVDIPRGLGQNARVSTAKLTRASDRFGCSIFLGKG